MKAIKYFLPLAFVLFASCSSLVLKPADFSWPVESVLKADNDGNVSIQRYSIIFNVKPLFLKETGDSTAYQNEPIRVIRNTKGYYFMVANNFKNVYVFNVNDGAFSLCKTIEIFKKTGIVNPAFNQRSPYIELVYGQNSDQKLNLTEKGIVKQEGK